ncbi:MAG TPA: YetF domain-containing protein [Bacillota bacterium]
MEQLREIFNFSLNMIGIYLAALLVVRIMGKRALGELSLFDFVIMVGIGDVIVIVGLEQQVPLGKGLLILILLGILEYTFSLLTFKYPAFSRLIEGTPTLLIKDGVIYEKNLAKEHISRADLRQELRKEGVSDISQVSRAILEACGKFSVILKEDSQAEDLNLQLLQEFKALRREVQELKAKLLSEREN